MTVSWLDRKKRFVRLLEGIHVVGQVFQLLEGRIVTALELHRCKRFGNQKKKLKTCRQVLSSSKHFKTGLFTWFD